MNKVSSLGVQLGSWGPRPFIRQDFVSLACILGIPFVTPRLPGELPVEKTGLFCSHRQGWCREGQPFVVTAERGREWEQPSSAAQQTNRVFCYLVLPLERESKGSCPALPVRSEEIP